MKTQLFSHPYKMASRLLLTACLAFILLPSYLPTQRRNTDAAYFNDKKLMLTARWEKPFSREEKERFTNWLKIRLNTENVTVYEFAAGHGGKTPEE